MVSELLPRLDEPFSDSSILPTALICQRARREVTVCLTGDGGDELLGGYTRYSAALANQDAALSGPRRALAMGILPALPLHALKAWKLAARLRRALQPPAGRYVEALVSADARVRASIMGPETLGRMNPEALEAELRATLEGPGDLAGRMMQHDYSNYLPGMVLRKVDMASMMNSLEIRSPLLDHTLVEWAASLPSEFKITGNERKRLLRASLQGRVPQSLLERGKKGFGSPMGRWLRQELRPMLESRLGHSQLARDGWLDQDGLDALLRTHLSRGHKMNDLVWSLLSAESWYRTWVTRQA
jgi:asparagine synthase (glutamine-hydrolysing)